MWKSVCRDNVNLWLKSTTEIKMRSHVRYIHEMDLSYCMEFQCE